MNLQYQVLLKDKLHDLIATTCWEESLPRRGGYEATLMISPTHRHLHLCEGKLREGLVRSDRSGFGMYASGCRGWGPEHSIYLWMLDEEASMLEWHMGPGGRGPNRVE